MPDLSDVIEEAASAPKSTTVDGTTVLEHDLQQLIEADRYLKQSAAQSTAKGGVKFAKLRMPGAS